MELEAGEVRHPGEGGGLARNDLFGRAAGGKAQCGRLDPGRTRSRRTLLVEEIAVDPVRVADENIRAVACRAQRAVGDGEVVIHEVELRVARGGKEHLVRVGDGHLAHADPQNLAFGLARHEVDYTWSADLKVRTPSGRP
jgi:hypothetical protein